MAAKTCLSHEDYTVGWICALPIEIAAAQSLLDEVHECLPRAHNDPNSYILGLIGDHNVVIACLPSGIYGTSSATVVAMGLLSTFQSIRFGLMVGIGGGIPRDDADIRLGDIIVSKPTLTHSGVVQYDLGKASEGVFERTGMLNHPPQVLLTALSKLQATLMTNRGWYVDFLTQLEMDSHHDFCFARPSQDDCLYEAQYIHADPRSDSCSLCDSTKVISRPARASPEMPVVHYGLVASGNQVVKDAKFRDRLGRELGAYCVEMEAAGLMNAFPSLVIRGICDYADSHKNKAWQGYAAATAATFAKEVLLVVSGYRTRHAQAARNVVSDAASKFQVPLNLRDVSAVEQFIGREDEVGLLRDQLQPLCLPMRKVVILHGLGGIGKTQLAIRFARIHKDDFTAIFWFDARNRGALIKSLASACLKVTEGHLAARTINKDDLEQRAQGMLHWLSINGNSRWLVIFDNVDHYSPASVTEGPGGSYDIRSFFPTADHGSIIITTRLAQMAELGVGYLVQRLSSKDSISLLNSSSSYQSVQGNNSRSDSGMQELAHCLDGLPLAISIAGSYIRQTGMSASQYLRYYKASWQELMARSTPLPHYPHENLLTTWIITLEKLQKSHSAAAKLLPLLANFDNQDIWYELVRACAQTRDPPGWLVSAVSTELSFVATMKSLIGFSLIQTNQDGGYSMHPVVQDWCLHTGDGDEDKLDNLRTIVLGSLCCTTPTQEETETTFSQHRLLPHADKMLRLLRTWSIPNDSGFYTSIHDLGCLYLSQGRLREAEESYQLALPGRERLLGPDHTSTLETLNNLGLVYTNRGKFHDAEQMCQRALSGREIALGASDVSTLDSANNLGFLYTKIGKPSKAEIMYKRALAGYEKLLGQEHSSTLDTINNLGLLYANSHKPHQAEAMYHKALAGFEKLLGVHHTSTLITANNLGTLYESQGKLEQARKMYKRALAGYKRILGPQHKSSLMLAHNLVNLDKGRARTQKSRPKPHQARARVEKAKRNKVAHRVAPVPTRHAHGLGKVSYSKGGKPVLSMVGWWDCCWCNEANKPHLNTGHCSICAHLRLALSL
ncbi:hypothetical protein BDV06DRAFT_219022 [Aspergillus oleicola]